MGSTHSTHIANGYKEDIKGKVTVDRDLYTRICREGGGKISNGAVGVEIHGKTEHELEHLIQLPGFVKIASGKFLAFSMSGEDGRVFVSISTDGKLIAENFPVRNGENVIVDADGDLRNAKPGKIWKDHEGKKHSIEQNRSSDVTNFSNFKRMPMMAFYSGPMEEQKQVSQEKEVSANSVLMKIQENVLQEEESGNGIFISSIRELVDSLETE